MGSLLHRLIHLLVAATIVAAELVAGLAVAPVSAQSGETVVRVTGPVEPVDKGDRIAFDVSVDNVENLAGFGIVLAYDPEVLDFSGQASDAQKGDFLGSSGREVVCNEPIRDAGSMRFSCVTLRAEPATGAQGSGKLATITLKAKGSGKSDVTLSRVQLTTVSDQVPVPEIEATAEGTFIEVRGGGFNWLIWGPVIAVGVLAAAAAGAYGLMRVRASGGSPATAT